MFKLHACLLTALLWLGVAAGQAPPPSPAPLPSKTEALKRFTAVQLCAPINTLVQPSNGTRDTYTITVQAEQPVLDALTWGVAGGLLSLQAGVFSTSRPIKVVVTMPATALEAISHYGTGAELLVAPGFNVGELNVTTAFGAGRLYVDGLRARTVRADLAGVGDTVLSGSLGNVSASSSSTGALYVAGVNDTVTLHLHGVSNAYVTPALFSARIVGEAAGIHTVQYSAGSCDVASAFVNPCQFAVFLEPPPPGALWSCGLETRGNFTCSAGGSAFTSGPGGQVTVSGGTATQPVSGTVPGGYSFVQPGAGGFEAQAGQVAPGQRTASSQVAGTGSVSAVSSAGPGGVITSTTKGGQTTTMQQPAGADQQGTFASTALSGAQPSTQASSVAVSSSTAGSSSSVARTTGSGPDAQTAAATGQACVATPAELRMPVGGATGLSPGSEGRF